MPRRVKPLDDVSGGERRTNRTAEEMTKTPYRIKQGHTIKATY